MTVGDQNSLNDLSALVSPELRAEIEAIIASVSSADEFFMVINTRPHLMQALAEATLATQGRQLSPLERVAYEMQRDDANVLAQPTEAGLLARIEVYEAFQCRPELATRPDIAADTRGNLAVLYLHLFDLTGDPVWAEKGEAILRQLIVVYAQPETENASGRLNSQRNLAALLLRRYHLSGDPAIFDETDRVLNEMLASLNGELRMSVLQTRLALYSARLDRDSRVEYQHAFGEAFLAFAEARRADVPREDWLEALISATRRFLEEQLPHVAAQLAERYLPEMAATDGEAWRDAHFLAGNAFGQLALRHEALDYFAPAIRSLSIAADLYTYADDPREWVLCHQLLSSLYVRRSEGERTDNLRRAAAYTEQIRANCPPQETAYATALMALCEIHATLALLTDPGSNAELGIVYGTEAIARYAAHGDYEARMLSAATQQTLSACYVYRLVGDPLSNLQAAEQLLMDAAATLESYTDQVHWAEVQFNLGNVLVKQTDHVDDRGLLERAIQHYQAAGAIFEREGLSTRLAMVLNGLGMAYRNSASLSVGATTDKRNAIAYYERAIALIDASTMPYEHGIAQMGIGNLYLDWYINDWDAAHLRRAYAHFFRALESFYSFPALSQRVRLNIATAHFFERAWEKAYQAFDQIISHGLAELRATVSEAGQRGAIAETAEVYGRAAYCLLAMTPPNYTEAFRTLEAGKTRLLAESLALENLDLSALPEDHSALREQIESLRAEISQHEGVLRQAQISARSDAAAIRSIFEQLTTKRQTLNALLAQVRDVLPNALLSAPRVAEILAAIPADAVLVAPVVTLVGAKCFVIPGGTREISADHILDLPELHDISLWAQLGNKPSFLNTEASWLEAMHAYKTNQIAKWRQLAKPILAWLWQVLMGPLAAYLAGLPQRRVLLMPSSGLQLLPLHAAQNPETGAYFCDSYELAYVPSGYALTLLATRGAHNRTTAEAISFVGGVADYSHHTAARLSDLPNTAAETALIAALTNTQAYRDATVNRGWLREAATQASLIHVACHGGFAWGKNPLATALYLHDAQPLTLAEIIGSLRFAYAPHITLSACETGVIEVNQAPDEFIGLPTGLLQAGAGSVLSSLWEVNDLAALLLMERFYHYHVIDGVPHSTALWQAQRWLRQVTKAELFATLRERSAQVESDALQAAYTQLIAAAESTIRSGERSVPLAAPEYWAAFTYTGI